MPSEVLTVSQVNRLARETLQRSFPLLWVAGEVSNLTRASSGHVYFSLKDPSAQVRCVMFRNRAQLIAWRLENGQQIEAQVLVTLYEARGEFQLNVEGMRRAGIGALYEAYAQLRDALEREGLFAPQRKREIPRFPRRVGIVSSPQAAALSDIVTALARRAPHVPVILYPTAVQGDGAGATIAAAITLASERAECDVLIVARGGGSIEDLWAFNEECVARAIAASRLPVVSGVGHETDTTICDFVADRRAATPTAAAELVSAGWLAAADELAALQLSMRQNMRIQLDERWQAIDVAMHRLLHPGTRLQNCRHVLAHINTRLTAAVTDHLRRRTMTLRRVQMNLQRLRPATVALAGILALLGQRLAAATHRSLAEQNSRVALGASALAQLNPMATLQRGYAIVRDSRGAVVRDSSQLVAGDGIDLRFAHGHAQAHIDETG